MKRPIGGYFELELPQGKEYYPDLIKLNSGRNAFEYILRSKNVSSIYIPYYTCEVILEPIRKLNLAYSFYEIDSNLDPVINFNLGDNDYILYTNYFGVKVQTVIKLTKNYTNIIIDNSMAFFSLPLEEITTFYSPRKFFGVPDGGYASTDISLSLEMEHDVSYNRFDHLITRIDEGPEFGYKKFIQNDKSLDNQSIKKMSQLTQKILSGIDYESIIKKRNVNFSYLHEDLKYINLFKLNLKNINGPMVYPLLLSHGKRLREILIDNKIYVATYWPNMRNFAPGKKTEIFLAENLLALPVDQRYNQSHMDVMIKLIKDYEK